MPDQDSTTTRLVTLTQGQFAIVDAEDFERVNEIKWRAQPRKNNKWYARSMSLKGRQFMMHRFILGIDDPAVQVDHRDRNGLNNQKSNLRPCNNSQNHFNSSKVQKDGITSKYRGVSIITGKNKWRAGILALGRRRDLGTYKSEVDAAHAYDAAAVKFFGEFANTNFPYVPPNLRVEVYDPLKELQEIADDLAADGDCIACLKTEAAIQALSRYFPPASQTPNSCPSAETFVDNFLRGNLWLSAEHESEKRDAIAVLLKNYAKHLLAIPASTARTDGWVSVEESLPKTTGVYGIYPPEQIDKDQGLNFSPRYFFANEDRNTYVGNKLAYGWAKDKNHKVTHWRELPAAPGSVPQAPDPLKDDSRCAVCCWPLAESAEKGCVRGNCSMRPFPEVFYDLERAEREYGKKFGVPQAEPPKCQIIGCNNKVAEMRHCVEHLPGNFPPDVAGDAQPGDDKPGDAPIP